MGVHIVDARIQMAIRRLVPLLIHRKYIDCSTGGASVTQSNGSEQELSIWY